MAKPFRPQDRKQTAEALLNPLDKAPALIAPVVIFLAGLLAYVSSFAGQFVFDDAGHILAAENIRKLWPIESWLLGNPRPIVTLSLALNYHFNGFRPFGYHVVNLFVHLSAGLVLYEIIRRTLSRRPCFKDRFAGTAVYPAFAVALLWVAHPLQTQSVTYIIQRSESMMGLFFLLSMLCFIVAVDSRRGWAWLCLSAFCFMLALGCKVAIIAAPLLFLIYDRLFVAPSYRAALSDRGLFYIGLVFAALAVLTGTNLLTSLFSRDPGYEVTVGLGTKNVTPLQYLSSQPGVILHYLRLVFVPYPLCLDYEWRLPTKLTGVVLPAVPLLAMLLLTLRCLAKKHWLGFAGAWFFLLIAPSSSIIPVKDLAMEHRMYLPLAAVLAPLVAAALYLASRFAVASHAPSAARQTLVALLLLLTVVFGYLTYDRNTVYHSPIDIWADIVRHRPENARAWCNFGESLAQLKKRDTYEDATRAFSMAIQLDPSVSSAHFNLGNSLQALQRWKEAEQAYLEALRLAPTDLHAHIMLGNLYTTTEQYAKAETEFRAAIAAANDQTDKNMLAKAHYNLGNVLFRRALPDESFLHYQKAVEIDPNYDKAHYGLGWILAKMHRRDEALEHLTKAIQLNPNNTEARIELDDLLNNAGPTTQPGFVPPSGG